MKEQIENSIFESVSDINKWQDILELFVKATGASKGIITLRDRLTAELVIPNNVSQELGSPLVHGFSKQEVHSYITNYIEHDPWTNIENLYHPEEAYALSSHLKSENLIQHTFWEWLEPQGVNDSIVFKIGNSSSKYWVAMNLYYHSDDYSLRQTILSHFQTYKNIVRNAWIQGQKVRLSHFKSSYAEYFIEQQGQPSFLINANREILQKNNKATIFQNTDRCPFYTSLSNKLQLRDSKINTQLQNAMVKLEQHFLNSGKGSKENLTYKNLYIQISFIGQSESLLGEKTALFQLSVYHPSEKQLIWKSPSLTRRESELVEILAKGGRVVDFQNHYNIVKSTAHMHWRNVKEKLDVKDRADIHVSHQLFLKNL